MSVRGYTGTKDDHLKRLRRVEGQTRGLARRVEEAKDAKVREASDAIARLVRS